VHQTTKAWSNRFVAGLIVISSIVISLVLVLMRTARADINFALGFNAYSLFSFSSALIDCVTLYLVLRKRRYTLTTNWFLLFLGGATLVAITEGLQRSSLHPAAALFWQSFSYISLALLPPAFYLFILSYTSQHKRQFVLLSSVILLAWGIMAFLGGDSLFFIHNLSQVDRAPWGYQTDTTQAVIIEALWSSIFYIVGTGLLFQLRKANHNKLIKKQLTTFMLAFLVPFVVAIATNVILPKVKPDVVPPLATFVGGFAALLVFYGMRKYRLFELDPQILAQNILDTMSEAVIISRLDGTIESINLEAERLLGVTAETVSDQRLESFFSATAWQQVVDKIAHTQADNTEQLISKSEVKNANGQVTPVRITVTGLIDAGERMATILVLSDITELTQSFDALQQSTAKVYQQNEELKKLETQLREEKANVEHTVEVRTKELREAQERLKAADQLKTEFIMLTSHNLRTPLATAQGYADMLKAIPENELPMLDGLKAGLKRLGEFVEDLLTISSIEGGDQLMLEEILPKDIIEPLIPEVTDLARTRNDTFTVNQQAGTARIKGDLHRLQGAIRNLLSNACKYTENGTVELSTKQEGNSLFINVSDTGIGIENDELTKLFTKFHRATDPFTSTYEGEGIGLYITKLIIDEHGGKISVTSQPGKGSTFSIELPCFVAPVVPPTA
jgi:PAS domain S-box-containing protein